MITSLLNNFHFSSPRCHHLFLFDVYVFFWRPLKAWCAFEHLSLGHRWSLEAEKTSPAFESSFSRPLNRSNSPTENTPLLQFLSILNSKFLITLWKEISPEINWCNYHVKGPIIFMVKHFWIQFISDNFLVWNMWVTIQPFSSDMSDIHLSFSVGGGGAQFSRFWKFTRDVRRE